VTVRDCATVNWDLDVNGAGTNPAYDNTFVKCFAQGSPIGMSLGNAGGNAFYGCSVQSSRLYGGVGFLVKAAAVGNLISRLPPGKQRHPRRYPVRRQGHRHRRWP